jgi:hypothetical protein
LEVGGDFGKGVAKIDSLTNNFLLLRRQRSEAVLNDFLGFDKNSGTVGSGYC